MVHEPCRQVVCHAMFTTSTQWRFIATNTWVYLSCYKALPKINPFACRSGEILYEKKFLNGLCSHCVTVTIFSLPFELCIYYVCIHVYTYAHILYIYVHVHVKCTSEKSPFSACSMAVCKI